MHFNLLHMVLVSVFAFVFEMLSNVLRRPITGLALASISATYSLWFAISELPILMKNEKTIQRIIKSFLLKNAQNLQFENSVFDRAIKNFISTRGIKEAFYRLRSKKISDDVLLFLLLSRQIDFLTDLLDSIKAYKKNSFVEYGGVDAVEILSNIYKSISDLTDLNDKFNYLIYDKDGQNIYLLTRLSYLANELSKELSLADDKSIEKFKRILLHYHWRSENNINSLFFNNYILTMTFLGITRGDFWFFKAFRDNDYPPYLYELKKDELIYLSSMLACFAFNSRNVDDKSKNQITDFMDEPSKGLNSNGFSLRINVANSINSYAHSTNLFEGLKIFIDVGLGLKEHTFDIFPQHKGVFLVDDSSDFNVYLLTKYWLEVLLFHDYIIYSSDDLFNYLNGLPGKHRDIVASVIENRLLNSSGSIDKDMKTPYLDFIFPEHMGESKKVNKLIFDALVKFKNDYNQTKYEESHKPIDDKALQSIKNRVDEIIEENVKVFESNEKLDGGLFKEYIRVLRIEGENDELIPLLEAYLKGFKESIRFAVSRSVSEEVDAISAKKYKYSKEQVDEILNFAPELANDLWVLKYSCTEQQQDRLEKMTISRAEYLPRYSFAKKDGVIFVVEYNKLASMPRKAIDREINEIIDEEYIPTNGLYTFSKYHGSSNGNFLVTREELFNRIKDRVILVPLVIRIAVKVDKTKVKLFKFED